MLRKHQANLSSSDLSLPGYSVDDMVNNHPLGWYAIRKRHLEYLFYGRLGATVTNLMMILERLYK